MHGIINPVFGQTKCNGSIRPVVNLSHTNCVVQLSVNAAIDPELCSVKLIKRLELIYTAKLVGKTGYCWAKDLKDGYYNVPIRKADSLYLGIKWLGKFFFFTTLPFGLSSAPFLFTKFMTLPMDAIRLNNIDIAFTEVPRSSFPEDYFMDLSGHFFANDSVFVPLIKIYIDDIFGFHSSPKLAWKQYHRTEKHLKLLNLQTKESKSKPPATSNIILGSVFDLEKQELRSPIAKIQKYLVTMELRILKSHITKKELLQDIGIIRHLGGIHHSLNAFARGLELYAHSMKSLHHHIKMSKQLISDYLMCMSALRTTMNVGISFDFILKPANAGDVVVFSDAALTVGVIGAFVSTDFGPWFAVSWTDISLSNPTQRDIQWRELSAIFVMVQCRKHACRELAVKLFCDNEAICWMLIKMRAPLHMHDLQVLIRFICHASIDYGFVFWIEHIAGVKNVIADALSRQYPSPFETYSLNPGENLFGEAVEFLQQASDLASEFVNIRNLIFNDNS